MVTQAASSAVSGYLAPLPSPSVLEDEALENFAQAFVVGVTGMDGRKVFPRWQPEPPNLSARGENWCSFGITLEPSDSFASVQHSGAGQGMDQLLRQEQFALLCSFYGPGGMGLAARLRDGCQIAQNREELQRNNFALVETSDILTLPSLVKELWLHRFDITVTLVRSVRRNYNVLNLLSEKGTLKSEFGSTSIDVTP